MAKDRAIVLGFLYPLILANLRELLERLANSIMYSDLFELKVFQMRLLCGKNLLETEACTQYYNEHAYF